jgi:lipase (class 3)
MALSAGFDLREALDLLHFCAITENGVAPPIPPNPPPGWTSLFVSPVIPPFDNLWQLWRRDADGVFAIAIRGTVYQAGSIAEDVLALMIKATGTLTVGPFNQPYSFSADPLAGVHLGFAVATLLVAELPGIGILDVMRQNNIGANAQVFVTGHSQGAAMASLLRSYLQYAPNAPAGVSYKAYVYAQPKPGNDHYAADFENRFSNPGRGFRVTNSLDWVPQVPFTLEFLGDVNVPNPLSVLTQPELAIRIASAMRLKAIEQTVDELGHLIVAREIDRVRPALQQLAAAKAGPAAAAGAIDMPLMFSFNYLNAGTNFSLMGNPCVGPQCADEFFEHHAATYYGLLAPPQGAV